MSGVLSRPPPRGGVFLSQLDTLRGLAILAVFAQHLGDPFRPLWEPALASLGPASPWALTIANHAWWGVDLFFVLSGFSLALGYLRAVDSERSRSRPSARAFLLRRAARIVPAYAVAVAVVLATRPSIAELPGFAEAMAAHAILLQGYVSPGGISLIGATWSLTTETHFYILFPLLAAPILGRRALRVGLAVCAAAWISRAALHAIFLEPGAYSGLFELTQRRLITSRLDQFVLGMMAAAVYIDLKRSPLAARAARLAPFALAASALLVIAAFRMEGELFLAPIGSLAYAALSLATAALVLSACLCDVQQEAPREPRGAARAALSLAWRPLAALGVVSYGVFLYHQLALGFTRARVPFAGGEPTWIGLGVTAAVALTASIALGALSWVFVERPFLRGFPSYKSAAAFLTRRSRAPARTP
jgi:peptidoglycan/LPS O-acetylase OafA/YrhL